MGLAVSYVFFTSCPGETEIRMTDGQGLATVTPCSPSQSLPGASSTGYPGVNARQDAPPRDYRLTRH